MTSEEYMKMIGSGLNGRNEEALQAGITEDLANGIPFEDSDTKYISKCCDVRPEEEVFQFIGDTLNYGICSKCGNESEFTEGE